MANMLDAFVAGLKNTNTGGLITTVSELRENQYGIPLKHYAQQYLFGATGLRIQVFNSIQGQKEAGKSTTMFDLMGDCCGAEEDGGLGGISVLYELEGKISPSILYSILRNHGERATQACIPRLGMTLEEAMEDLNKNILPLYKKSCPKMDKPLLIGFDSIGGAASGDTIDKLQKEGAAGKGYYNKQHFMKYFCENQGAIFARSGIPVVVMCINQEKEEQCQFNNATIKTITGGRAQLFKDGHMISAKKKPLSSGDGNVLTLSTTKTSFCDSRKIDVQFRWNKYGVKQDDAYEARFLWGLAAAKCIAEPEKGVGEIRDICNVKVGTDNLITCQQLGLTSVTGEEFEEALMANKQILDQLYTYQKIERLKDLSSYGEFIKGNKPKAKDVEAGAAAEETPAPKTRSRRKKAEPVAEEPQQAEPKSIMDVALEASEDAQQ